MTWVGQTDKISSDETKTEVIHARKVTNMRNDEGNKGDQYKSYKEVIKEHKDRNCAFSTSHGGDRGRGKIE